MSQQTDTTSTPRPRRRRWVRWFIGLGLLWIVVAYAIAPMIWDGFTRMEPAIEDAPTITQTGDHHPGDPLNVQLIGSEPELESSMKAAGWYRSAKLGMESDLKIAADTVLSRPDDAAPVSNLYLFGRKEDFAFEQPVGDSPRHRHHVRFWKTDDVSHDGRSKWLGSAVYDERVGISRTTGQITHVTAADVDTERDYLFACLEKSGRLESTFIQQGFHKRLAGRNGGGDPWRTDGDLYVGVLKTTSDETERKP